MKNTMYTIEKKMQKIFNSIKNEWTDHFSIKKARIYINTAKDYGSLTYEWLTITLNNNKITKFETLGLDLITQIDNLIEYYFNIISTLQTKKEEQETIEVNWKKYKLIEEKENNLNYPF